MSDGHTITIDPRRIALFAWTYLVSYDDDYAVGAARTGYGCIKRAHRSLEMLMQQASARNTQTNKGTPK